MRTKPFPLKRNGFTTMELVVAMALLGILVIPAVRFTKDILKGLFRSDAITNTNEQLRKAFSTLSMDFFKANKIVQADATTVVFQVDAADARGFGINFGVSDFYGIPNQYSYDRDTDATVVPTQAGTTGAPQTGDCCVGNDLDDEDDDNDGKVDVLITYQLLGSPARLERSIQYNEGPPRDRTTVLDNVDMSVSSFTFFGSMAYMTGVPSTANPVVAATLGSDAGLVQGPEIDAKIGNNNGTNFDTQRERNWISVVRIQLGVLANKPDMKNPMLTEDVAPPLLPLKKKVNWP